MIDSSELSEHSASGPPARWQFAVSAGILGWVLDAFDFFVLVFLFDILAEHFHVGKGAIVFTLTVTLLTRPLGALILGPLADRYGRRRPLVACVLYFSLITALTPFAPNYAIFVLLRALYGIGMGGYWGIGASLVMESSPVRWRGLFSGMMQSGYSLGYLLAAVAMRAIEPRFGWRMLFLGGMLIAVLIAVLTALAPESTSWQKNKLGSMRAIFRVIGENKMVFAYCVLLMTGMTCLSHGTQDLYPDFLKTVHHFKSATVSNLAILYNVGALTGALVIGHFSDRIGRRYCVMLALTISLLAIPAWAFGASVTALAVGAFAMQFGVQGAFGVIPAHLNELSPGAVRGLFPGVSYQVGLLFGSASVWVEYVLRDHVGYRPALTIFELGVIAVLFCIFAFGPEKRERDFTAE